MRDAHRMKEKYDVALDNRQLVTAFTGGLVVLGAVFVLGVVVGKKLSAPEVPGTSIDLLTALDKKNDVLEEAREQPLTFQDELTRKAPDRVAADAGPLAAPSQLEVTTADAGAPPDKTTALAEGPKISLPTLEPVKAPVATETQATSAAPTEPKQTTAAVAKPESPKPAAPKPVAPLAAAKVDRVPASPSDLFTLQLAATAARSDADRQVAKLKGQGFSPYIEPAVIPGKGTMYRVRMGKFESREAAARFLTDFKRETKMNAFVAAAR